MTSFKRRAPSVQTPLPPGAKQCPGVPSIMHVSSGISSLDDILGGGIPLGCILTLLSPDPHSAWGDLIQRYFISEGLLSDQGVCVMGGGVEDLVKGCMWTQNTDDSLSNKPEDASRIEDGEIKIAWRYEKMRQFQTTVPDRSPSSCTFDVAMICRQTQSFTRVYSRRILSRFRSHSANTRTCTSQSL
jgi:elongator complex protein 4